MHLSQRRVLEPFGAYMHPRLSLFVVDGCICIDLVVPIFEIVGVQNNPTDIFRPILAGPLFTCNYHRFEHLVDLHADIAIGFGIEILVENPVISFWVVVPDVDDGATHCHHVSEAGLDMIERTTIKEAVELR